MASGTISNYVPLREQNRLHGRGHTTGTAYVDGLVRDGIRLPTRQPLGADLEYPSFGSTLNPTLGSDLAGQRLAATSQSSAVQALPKEVMGAERPRLQGRLSGPVKLVASIAERWHIDLGQLATLLDLESLDDVRWLLGGLITLRGRDRTDRVIAIFIIYEALHQIFQDNEVERAWVRESQVSLDGKSLFDLMTEGSMENLLKARQYVEYLSGR